MEIKSTILFVKAFALSMFTYMLISFYFLIGYASQIHSMPLLIFGFFISIIAPIIFNRKIRKLFLNQAQFFFSDKQLDIKIIKFKSEKLEKEYHFYYEDIISCFISSTSNRTSTVKIFLRDKRKFQCSFIDESKEIKEDNNVSFEIYKQLRSYNNRIILQPAFYASRRGKVGLMIFTILLIADLIMNVVFKPNLIPFSLIGAFAVYLQALMRWKRDTEIYNKQIESLSNGK